MYLQIQSKSFISEVDKSLETCYNFREPRSERVFQWVAKGSFQSHLTLDK